MSTHQPERSGFAQLLFEIDRLPLQPEHKDAFMRLLESHTGERVTISRLAKHWRRLAAARRMLAAGTTRAQAAKEIAARYGLKRRHSYQVLHNALAMGPIPGHRQTEKMGREPCEPREPSQPGVRP